MVFLSVVGLMWVAFWFWRLFEFLLLCLFIVIVRFVFFGARAKNAKLEVADEGGGKSERGDDKACHAKSMILASSTGKSLFRCRSYRTD